MIGAWQHRDQRTLMPPARPWINLGRGFYHNLAASCSGKMCRRFTTPKGCHAGASFGRWLMYEHKRSHRCFLRDPFSHATPAIEVPLIKLWRGADAVADTTPLRTWHGRLLVCSSDLLVAMYLHGKQGSFSITCFGPGITTTTHKLTAGPQNHAPDLVYKSIAFHHGKIFAVNSTENLLVHDFVAGEIRIEHVIKEQHPLGVGAVNLPQPPSVVTSADKKKLLMVRWRHPPKPYFLELVDHHTIDLQVFEADLENGKWSDLKDLGDQVLFVGRTGSMAFVASSMNWRYQGNHVYILGYEMASSRCQAANTQWIPDCEQCHKDTPSFCAYDITSGKANLAYLSGGVKYPMSAWLFPSH